MQGMHKPTIDGPAVANERIGKEENLAPRLSGKTGLRLGVSRTRLFYRICQQNKVYKAKEDQESRQRTQADEYSSAMERA